MSPPPATWGSLLGSARESLEGHEAGWIVERASGYPTAELIAHLDEPAPTRAAGFVESMVARRRAGEPLQYVLGVWAFRTLELVVDRRVLIPRPETEAVVEFALGELARAASRRDAAGEPARARHTLAADLGTGSGAIALSLAAENREVVVWGTDVSPGALALARANAAGCGTALATRIRLAEGSWFEALPHDLRGRLDLVVSNPPYVGDDEALPQEVADWEPAVALRAGPTGLEALMEVVSGSPVWLAPGGSLVVECGPHQADAVAQVAVGVGFPEVEVRPDLAGRPRAVLARSAG